MALDSNSSMNMVAIWGIIGKPMAVPWTCSKYLHRKRKQVVLGKTPSRVMICQLDMEVLWECRGSWSSLFLTMEMAGSSQRFVLYICKAYSHHMYHPNHGVAHIGLHAVYLPPLLTYFPISAGSH